MKKKASGGKVDDDYEGPDPEMEIGQAHLNHIAARGDGAANASNAEFKEFFSGRDLKNHDDTFGEKAKRENMTPKGAAGYEVRGDMRKNDRKRAEKYASGGRVRGSGQAISGTRPTRII